MSDGSCPSTEAGGAGELLRVAVAVVARTREDGRREYLVGRRAQNAMDGPGLDEFPGGKVERHETPAEAAARECLEEAGLIIEVGPLLDRARGTSSAGAIDVWFFSARPPEGDDRDPCPPFFWLPEARLAELRFPATNRGVLSRILGTPRT